MRSFFQFNICIAIVLMCSWQNLHAKEKTKSYDEKILVCKGPILGTTGLLNDKNPLHYLSSDFICIDNYAYIEYNLPCSSGAGIAFYDSEKRFIASRHSLEGGVIYERIPEKSKYIRVSYRTDDGFSFLLKLHNDPKQFQKPPSSLIKGYSTIIDRASVKRALYRHQQDTTKLVVDYVRIPVIKATKDDCIVVLCQAKVTSQNGSDIYLVAASSNDCGDTWHQNIVAKGYNPNIVYDEVHDKLFLFSSDKYFISDGMGLVWEGPFSLNIKLPYGWSAMYQSPTTGIQLCNGVLATTYELFRYKGKDIEANCCSVLYSVDFGKNWTLSTNTPSDLIANESTIIELPNRKIMINARGGTEVSWGSNNPGRRVFVSNKLSTQNHSCKIDYFKRHISDCKLVEPICNASFISFETKGKSIGLFCNPNVKDNPRRNLTLKATKNFRTWKEIGLLTPYNERVRGYSGLSYHKDHLYFVYDNLDEEIAFADISSLIQLVENKLKL